MKMLFRITQDSDVSRRLGREDAPEMGLHFTTEDAAASAVVAIMKREEVRLAEMVRRWNEQAQPDYAAKSWKDKRQTACFSQVRIDSCEVGWTRDGGRTGWSKPPPLVAVMLPRVSMRYRWRDVVQRIEAQPNGAGSIVYTLGKPSPWTAWYDQNLGDSHGGGPYLPAVRLTIVQTPIHFEAGANLTEWCGVEEWTPSKRGEP